MIRLGIVGWGSIGAGVGHRILEGLIPNVALVTVLRASGRALTGIDGIPVRTDVVRFLEDGPDLVLEAAGRDAMLDYALPIVEAGVPLMVMSVAAFADDAFRNAVVDATVRAKTRILVPAGGIAGIDGISAGYFGGLDSVVITQRKPPSASLPPEDAARCTSPILVKEVSARDAGVEFPNNANICVLAGLAARNLDDTRVRVIADPTVTRTITEVESSGIFGKMSVVIEKEPSENLHTAKMPIFSALAAIERFSQPLVLGA